MTKPLLRLLDRVRGCVSHTLWKSVSRGVLWEVESESCPSEKTRKDCTHGMTHELFALRHTLEPWLSLEPNRVIQV